MDTFTHHDPWDLPVRDLRSLLGQRTPRIVVERYEDSCVVTGFFSLDAEILLKFCRKWRLHVLIQFEESPNHKWKSFRIVLSAQDFTLELDPDSVEPKIDYSLYTAEERASIQPLVGQFSEVGSKEVRVVLFPKVIHLQFWPQLGITGNTLQDITQLSGVTKCRIGGNEQCIETIIQRPVKASNKTLKNRITKATKRIPGRRVSYGGTTQVVQAKLMDLNPIEEENLEPT
jgi:hypothetical protein